MIKSHMLTPLTPHNATPKHTRSCNTSPFRGAESAQIRQNREIESFRVPLPSHMHDVCVFTGAGNL
jgi:hypothetical protein